MKKFLVCMLLVAMLFYVSACSLAVPMEKTSDHEETTDTSMFIQIEQGYCWMIVYHKDTHVMYAISDGSYSRGNFVVLVNADGTPMIYENDRR